MRIFISYRRDDAPAAAGRLYDSLITRFGFSDDDVFMDVDAIEPGVDFTEVIEHALESCQVFLAVIGPRWLEVQDRHGRVRLHNPDDFVRLEIEAALRRGTRVIPVLVQGAEMPTGDRLPESLRALVRRQAVELDDASWFRDLAELSRVLEQLKGRTGRSKPGGEGPVHRIVRHPLSRVAVGALVVGVFGILFWRPPWLGLGSDPPPDIEWPPRYLKQHIPLPIRDTCEAAQSAYETAVAAFECEPRGAETVVYNFFRTLGDTRDVYRRRAEEVGIEGGDAQCGTAQRAESTYTNEAEKIEGRLLCYKNGLGEAWVEWTDDVLNAYSSAYREDGQHDLLFEFWTTAGPD